MAEQEAKGFSADVVSHIPIFSVVCKVKSLFSLSLSK